MFIASYKDLSDTNNIKGKKKLLNLRDRNVSCYGPLIRDFETTQPINTTEDVSRKTRNGLKYQECQKKKIYI